MQMSLSRLFIITGDASADLHASHVVKRFQAEHPNVEIQCIGGAALASTGISIFHDQRHLGAYGLDIFRVIPSHFSLGKRLIHYFKTEWRPDGVLLIDYGLFNLWLAPQLKALGIAVFYYIPPQIWASRRGRIKQMQQGIEKVCCIFPFEKPIYDAAKIPAVYVGHPVLEELPPSPDRKEFCLQHGLDPERPIIGIFPGSRLKEVERLLPSMLKAIPLISGKMPVRPQFVLAQSDAVSATLIDDIIQRHENSVSLLDFCKIQRANYAILALSQTAMVASGTVTLEAALYRTPVVIVYRLSKIAHWIFRRFSYVSYIGLPNLLAQEKILPELIMSRVSAEAIAHAIEPFLSNSPFCQQVKMALGTLQQDLSVASPPSLNVMNELCDFFSSSMDRC